MTDLAHCHHRSSATDDYQEQGYCHCPAATSTRCTACKRGCHQGTQADVDHWESYQFVSLLTVYIISKDFKCQPRELPAKVVGTGLLLEVLTSIDLLFGSPCQRDRRVHLISVVLWAI